MKIAIPLADGKLAMHFGHCASFALIDFDPAEMKILGREDVPAPPHQPGLLPPWLAERGVKMVIAGGMGKMACDLLEQQGITVVLGAPAEEPEKLITEHFTGTMQIGDNPCGNEHPCSH